MMANVPKVDDLKQLVYSLHLKRKAYEQTKAFLLADIDTESLNCEKDFDDAMLIISNERSYRIKKLKTRLHENENALSLLNDEHKSLTTLVTSKKRNEIPLSEECSYPNVEQLRLKLDTIRQETQQFESEKIILEEQLNSLMSHLTTLKRCKDETKEYIKKQNEKISELQMKVEELALEHQNLQKGTQIFQLKNMELKKKGNSMFSEFNDRKDYLESKIATLELSINKQHKHNEILELQFRSLVNQAEQTMFQEEYPSVAKCIDAAVTQAYSAQKMLLEELTEELELDTERNILIPIGSGKEEYKYLFSLLENKRKLFSTINQYLESQRLLMANCHRQVNKERSYFQRIESLLKERERQCKLYKHEESLTKRGGKNEYPPTEAHLKDITSNVNIFDPINEKCANKQTEKGKSNICHPKIKPKRVQEMSTCEQQ